MVNLRIAPWVATAHGDEGEGEEEEDQNDLATREPELSFTIRLDSENVQQSKSQSVSTRMPHSSAHWEVALGCCCSGGVEVVAWGDSRIENDGDHDDSCVWDIVSPETEDFTQGGNFEGDQEGFVEEEVPSGHESKGIVDPFTGKTNETTRDGHHGCHFSYAVID